MGVLKQAAGVVLAPLSPSGSQAWRSSRRSRSRTVSTLRVPKWLLPGLWKGTSWRPWVWAGEIVGQLAHSHTILDGDTVC